MGTDVLPDSAVNPNQGFVDAMALIHAQNGSVDHVQIGSESEFVHGIKVKVKDSFTRSKEGFVIPDGVFFAPDIENENIRTLLIETVFQPLKSVLVDDITRMSNEKLTLSFAEGAYLRSLGFGIEKKDGSQILSVDLLLKFPSATCSSNFHYADKIENFLKLAFQHATKIPTHNINVSVFYGGSSPTVEEMNCGSDFLNSALYQMINGVREACGGCSLATAKLPGVTAGAN